MTNEKMEVATSKTDLDKAQMALNAHIADLGARMARDREAKCAARAVAVPALDVIVSAIRRGEGTDQGRRLVRFLAGIFNGPVYPFDLTDLRRLDTELADACMAVLNYDRWIQEEIHHWGVITGEELWGFIKRAGLYQVYEERQIGGALYRSKFPSGHTDEDMGRHV